MDITHKSTIYEKSAETDVKIAVSVFRAYGVILKQKVEMTIVSRKPYWFEVEKQTSFRTGRPSSDHLFCVTKIIEKKIWRLTRE